MIVGLAYERYNSLLNPHLHRTRENTCGRLVLYITSIAMFSILYSIPKFLEKTAKASTVACNIRPLNEEEKLLCKMPLTELRKNHHYILWYINVSNVMVLGVVPLVLLMFLNYKIYISLKQRLVRRALMIAATVASLGQDRNNREIRHTFVLFAIVALFVLCHALRIILNIQEFVSLETNDEQHKQGCPAVSFGELLAIPFSQLLLEINASTNFFIYCIYDIIFKEVLKSTMQRIKDGLLRIRDFIHIPNTTRSVEVPQTSSTTYNLSTHKLTCENIELREVH